MLIGALTGNKLNLNLNYSKDFLPHFDDASQYALTNNFNFFKVNCQHKNICSHFNINRYPTLKVFYKGKELEEEPSRDLKGVLEFVDKLANPSLVEIKSQKEITNFKTSLSDGSFLLIYETKDSEFFKCVEELAENKYKLLFYVGYADKKIYNNNNLKIDVPSIIVIF